MTLARYLLGVVNAKGGAGVTLRAPLLRSVSRHSDRVGTNIPLFPRGKQDVDTLHFGLYLPANDTSSHSMHLFPSTGRTYGLPRS